jgi:hypothetical protein
MNQSATTPPEKRPKHIRVDWDAVIRDFRVDALSDTELANKHKLSREAIVRRRKKDTERDPSIWLRDLSPQVRAATNALLMSESIANKITCDHEKVTGVIMAQAEVNKSVILEHRHGLNRITRIKAKLLDHIEQAVDNLPELAQIVEMVRCEGENGMDKANDALKKSLGRGAIVDDLKKLAEVDEKVRKGEREAFSITTEAEEAAARPQRRVMIEFVDVVAK